MTFLWMDVLEIRIRTQSLGAFLQQAAQNGCTFYHLREENGCYTARIKGNAAHKLDKTEGAALCIQRRIGPGIWAERLCARSGLVAGLLLFAVLTVYLPHLLWRVDFGTLEQYQQQEIRQMMESCQIREGCLLTEEKLTALQNKMAEQSAEYAWVSLNFIHGRLMMETTQTRQQSIQPPASQQALYAAANGKILSVQLTSGFSLVSQGQYVVQGEKIAVNYRLNHSGEPVEQAVEGSILGEMTVTYRAEQPLMQQKTILTGKSQSSQTLYLLGQEIPLEEGEKTENTLIKESWLPIQIGKIAFPAVLYTRTEWEQTETEMNYSVQQAEALACRQCRQQLRSAFPDAVLLSEQADTMTTETGVAAAVEYTIRGNIAVPASEDES